MARTRVAEAPLLLLTHPRDTALVAPVISGSGGVSREGGCEEISFDTRGSPSVFRPGTRGKVLIRPWNLSGAIPRRGGQHMDLSAVLIRLDRFLASHGTIEPEASTLTMFLLDEAAAILGEIDGTHVQKAKSAIES